MRQVSFRALLLSLAPALALTVLTAVFACPCAVRAEGNAPTLTNSVGMEFVLISAGSFGMGCSASELEGGCFEPEKPRHTVTISKPFYLGKHEVTQAQWEAVMGNNPSEFKGPDRPVENVSWEDAQEFIKKLNAKEGHNLYRLPTEAEWEYAARAGSQTAYSFGNDKGQLGNYAWYEDNAGGETHPVGQKQANAWGLHDMHGNVWEWVADWEGPYSAGRWWIRRGRKRARTACCAAAVGTTTRGTVGRPPGATTGRPCALRTTGFASSALQGIESLQAGSSGWGRPRA